jgi:DNA-binding CsgD family transcriptional regulator
MGAALQGELVENIEGLGRRGEVLACIWAGRSTKEIGAELGISPKTVEYHRALLYRDFGVNDLVSLCRRAIEEGLIDPKSDGRRKAESRRRLAGARMPEAMPTQCQRIANASPTHGRRIGRLVRRKTSRSTQ